MIHGFSVRRVWAACFALAIIAAGSLAGANLRAPAHAQEPAMSGGVIERFHLLAPGEGWLLINNQLYWTVDNGGSWKDITPAIAHTRKIAAVSFVDSSHGWAALTDYGTLLSNVRLEYTADSGASWKPLPAGAFAKRVPLPVSHAVQMQWLDPQIGWIMFQASTSSSFSDGRLFRTLDAGLTWTELAIPVGESFYFASPSSGWAVGRDGDSLYHTSDGGKTWRPMVVDEEAAGEVIRQYMLPAFDTPDYGLTAVLARDATSEQKELRLYTTRDGGASWSLLDHAILDAGSGTLSLIPLDLLDSNHAVVVIPHWRQILRVAGTQSIDVLRNPDGLSENITKIDMASTDVGWATWLSKRCSLGSNPVPPTSAGSGACMMENRLLSTADGGAHWSLVSLPPGISVLAVQPVSGLRKPQMPATTAQGLSAGAQVFAGQGFDTCMPPSPAEMGDWWNSSPYGVWNLYIGGANRGCKIANQATINASFVAQLHEQGWQFIPAWVGLQAPCSSLNVYLMSSDPRTAYRQGITDANAASEAVADLGFSHTIVYFDLEYFSPEDAACLAAVKSFISGWTAQLHSRGNQAAVYGSACGAGVDEYYGIANVPDAIWPAAWTKSGYDSSVSVWEVPCIPDTHWSNHQRIWQYAGEHDESWGSTILNVDSNVLDGIVGLPSPDCNNPRPDGDHIGLYSEENYCGEYAILGVGDYSDPSTLGITNDSVSSIKVGKNVEAILCADANYLGVCEDFTATDWNLGGNSVGNNRVSSVKVVKRLVLISPPSGASLRSLRPALDWADVPAASAYNVQLSRDAGFTDLVTSATVSSSSYTPTADMPANSWLFWRARAEVAGMWRGWSLVAKFKTANPPSVPVLRLPPINALTRNYRPMLDWNDSALPAGTTFDHYDVQVDDNLNFSSPVIAATTPAGDLLASSYVPPSRLASNTTYYWRVRAYNSSGEYSSWSVRWSFRTPLPPPILKSPANGTVLSSNRPVFRWSDIVGAASYRIQVSRNPAFTQIAWIATCPKARCTAPTDLPAAIPLFWRVSTNGANGPSAWSGTRSFTTANPPSIPVLRSPGNDALVKNYRPRFDWNDSSVPAGTLFHNYQVQIAEDAVFASMYVQADVNGEATASEFTLPAPYKLVANRTYYWRVRAFNTELEYSSWSTIWKLRTAILPPVLLAPANGSTVLTPRPAFAWQDVAGASQYTIQISTTPDFSAISLQASPSTSAFTPTTDLAPAIYYWRVMAIGTNGPSNWSNVWSCTIQ